MPAPHLAATALLALSLLTGCGGEDAASATGVSCDYPSSGAASKEVEPPPAQATVSGEVPVTVATGVGEIPLTLDADDTPCTVGSFTSLAEQGYFDGTQCHRLTTAGIFVLQCGDPTGSGMGGPGYSFADELSGEETYPAGTLAMANGGPDTNGSQFFMVYDDTELPANYTVFGTIDDAGLQVLRDVAAQGTQTGASDGPPQQPVEIESVTVG
jgi:peptidyl-prolyl cis-trans isomerase B (cyclophilin B)